MKKAEGKPKENISLKKAMKGAEKSAQRKSFRKGLPVAISKDGKVYLLYPDMHMELATEEKLKALTLKNAS